MGKIGLYEIVIFIGTIIISTAFVMAFRLRKDKRLPVYYKFLYIMVLPRLVMSFAVTANTLSWLNINKMVIIQNICVISDFILITYFFYLLHSKKLFTLFFFIIATVFIILYLSKNSVYLPAFELNALLNLAVFLYCLRYFYSLFEHVEKVSILRNPTFLIVLGVFLFATVNFPLLSIRDYLRATFGIQASHSIVSLINFFIILRFVFVIWACSRTIVNYYVEDSATPVKKLTDEFPFLEEDFEI